VTKLHFTQIYLCILAFTVLALLMNLNLPTNYLMIGLAIAVTLLGLPHGALDFAVAKSLRLISGALSGFFFITAYTAIAIISIIFWINFPATALSIFLCISVYHFSADWRIFLPKYAALSLATIVICGPAIAYPSVVSTLFTGLLLSNETAGFIIQGMRIMFGTSLLGVTYFMLGKQKAFDFWTIAEWVALTLSSLVLTPLLHFGLYFCLLHSPKHLHDVSVALKIRVTKALFVSLPFVFLTLLLAAGAYMLFLRGGHTINLSEALLRWVFIGLFGLTMSHMLLISLWHRKQ
jgi:Brp/Blh family beta-carotene 15,15'-monooxygenase